MRVLFVTLLNKSQLYTMAPLIWATRGAGHQVRVACAPDLADDVAQLGFTPVEVGRIESDVRQDIVDAEPEADPEEAAETLNAPWVKPHQSEYGWGDPAQEWVHMTRDFIPLLTTDSFVDDLVGFAREWQPDLVVWNKLAYAGPVAAKAAGAASARFLWGVDAVGQLRAGWREAAAADPTIPDPLRDWLGPKLERHGVAYDESAVLGHFSIDIAPEWVYHHPNAGVRYLPVRHVPYNGPSRVPDWVNEKPAKPRVCLTLGFSHRESHGVEASAEALLAAVAELDIEVVATLSARQTAELGSVPDNVRVVEFVPLNVLLPTCAAIIHHGGTGTFGTALEHGVPQLIVPGTYWNEKYWAPVAQGNGLEEQGAGVYVCDSDRLTPEALRSALERVLGDPSYRENAERLRRDLAGRPTPNEAVGLMEKLTAEHRARS